jgi:hypothetical protein
MSEKEPTKPQILAEIEERREQDKRRMEKEWQIFQEENDYEMPETTIRSIFLAEYPDDGSECFEEEIKRQVGKNIKKIKESDNIDKVNMLIILNNELKTRLYEMRPTEPKRSRIPDGSIEIGFRDISPQREIIIHKDPA